MRNGILYHKNEIQEVNCPDRNTMQLVHPEAFGKQALQGDHDDLGHLRMEQTIDLLRDHFYWPGMIDDTTRHIKQCERCLRFKALPEKAPMENIDAAYPMELVHMDYLMIEANEGGKDVHIFGDNRSFYTICTSYHYQFTDHKMYSPKFMGQIYCPLWAS